MKKEREEALTINLLVPLNRSKNSFRAVLSFSLASLLDFLPLPFPFLPFFPWPFFLDVCFSCLSSFTFFFSFLFSPFFPPCTFFTSLTVESSLQDSRGKAGVDLAVTSPPPPRVKTHEHTCLSSLLHLSSQTAGLSVFAVHSKWPHCLRSRPFPWRTPLQAPSG